MRYMRKSKRRKERMKKIGILLIVALVAMVAWKASEIYYGKINLSKLENKAIFYLVSYGAVFFQFVPHRFYGDL